MAAVDDIRSDGTGGRAGGEYCTSVRITDRGETHKRLCAVALVRALLRRAGLVRGVARSSMPCRDRNKPRRRGPNSTRCTVPPPSACPPMRQVTDLRVTLSTARGTAGVLRGVDLQPIAAPRSG